MQPTFQLLPARVPRKDVVHLVGEDFDGAYDDIPVKAIAAA